MLKSIKKVLFLMLVFTFIFSLQISGEDFENGYWGTVEYNIDSAEINTRGSWETEYGEQFFGDARIYSHRNFVGVQFEFTGDEFNWYGGKNMVGGIAVVLINGENVGEVDTYSQTAKTQELLFSKDLEPGTHNVSIVNIDKRNENSMGNYISIDYLSVHAYSDEPFPEDDEIVEKAPFSGEPVVLPGTIMAAEYDEGGEGLSYHDTTPENRGVDMRDIEFRADEAVDFDNHPDDGYVIGWIDDGEWVEYTVDVSEAGEYELEFHTASGPGGGSIGIDVDGETLLEGISVPQTDNWNDYTTFTKSVELDAGEQVWRVNMESGGFNLYRIVVK